MPLDIANTGNVTSTVGSQPNSSSSTVFVIKEDISNNPLQIVLEDTDMPYGRPREMEGFNSGGKVDIAQGGIYNPGSERVVLQMMAQRENKMTIKGAFRDRIRAGVQRQSNTDAMPQHAKKQRDLVELIRRRANPLKISWDGEERTGVIEETVFGEEGPHDITYTITFFIAEPLTGGSRNNTNATNPTPSLEDLRAQMAADHAERQSELLALATNASVVAVISNALGFVSNAIDTLGIATTTIERAVLSTPQQVQSAVNNVNASATNVQTQIQAVQNAGYDKAPPDQAMVNQSVDDYMRWWAWQSRTKLTLDQEADAMRQIRQQATEQMRKATSLYRVQEGDTLESIALQRLGSKARASDLGIRQDQLIPGSYVRIPQGV
jgi:hypothetical protein